jgi:hypothetical protein
MLLLYLFLYLRGLNRFTDNIETYRKEILKQGVKWIHLAQVRGQWRAIIDVVDPCYTTFRYTAAAVIMSPNTTAYDLGRASFYEMFWLHYKSVLQHSLLQHVGTEAEVHSPVCFCNQNRVKYS